MPWLSINLGVMCMRNKLLKFIFVISITTGFSYPCFAGETFHSSYASNESDSEASYGASSENSHMPSTLSSQENASESSHEPSNLSRYTMDAPPHSGETGNPAPAVNMDIQERLGEAAKHVSVANRDGTIVLTGTVKTPEEKDKINGLAAQIGVPVTNEVKVENPDVQVGKVVTIDLPADTKSTAAAGKTTINSKPAAVSKPAEPKVPVKAVH